MEDNANRCKLSAGGPRGRQMQENRWDTENKSGTVPSFSLLQSPLSPDGSRPFFPDEGGGKWGQWHERNGEDVGASVCSSLCFAFCSRRLTVPAEELLHISRRVQKKETSRKLKGEGRVVWSQTLKHKGCFHVVSLCQTAQPGKQALVLFALR